MLQHAVITGDIVNSTKLKPKAEKRLMTMLYHILKPYKSEFYRGDSFQVYLKEPAKALQVVLQCRTAAISMIKSDEMPPCDIRASIGIGSVKSPVKNLATAKGEAFLLSGRAFDEISKDGTRLSIKAGNHAANSILLGLDLVSAYINSIYREMTSKQAEVIYMLLMGETQQKASKTLKKSKSTISQLVSSAKWPEIEKLMVTFENLIKEIK